MLKFKFLEDIAIADAAFEAYGKTYEELFENAGLALETVNVSLEDVASKVSKTIKLEEDSIDNLLFSFLSELVFLKDAKQLIFSKIKCEILQKNNEWELKATLSGDKINPKIHKLGTDVKAPTKHLFKIEQLPNKTYKCRVILDV